MTMLKRMRPEELREVSKAATALEKTKVEERKKKINANKKKVGGWVGGLGGALHGGVASLIPCVYVEALRI